MIKNITIGPLPSSEKTYIKSERFDDVQVAMRKINLSKESEKKSFIVYDTSGIYTDSKLADNIDLNSGLPKLRQKWIEERGDVEKYQGRNIKPEDNGIFVENAKSSVPEFDLTNFQPIRAKKGKRPTQLAYARAGIVTKEMEYIALRENMGRKEIN